MAEDLIQALRQAEIIPQVIPEDRVTEIKSGLNIVYPNVTVSRGETPARRDVLEVPEIEFPAADPSASYTIICTDPDLLMKGEQKLGPVRHWLQSGILFDSKTKRAAHQLGLNANVTKYLAPSPSPDFRFHRYVFIVARESPTYEAKGGKDYPVDGESDLKGRLQWNAAEYCTEEKLKIEGVGWMSVQADGPAIVENAKLTAESLVNKVLGK
ncbi:YbhB/YbcL family Raf kinase inhibitor-like protein [Sporobolomyces koalae]|uniref:YbhB/YbcL family Raf kinase inhibitor-like protein n=1 Tax=Sporobolomyces koalae TaxID=500713 RepID=UPI003179FA3D